MLWEQDTAGSNPARPTDLTLRGSLYACRTKVVRVAVNHLMLVRIQPCVPREVGETGVVTGIYRRDYMPLRLRVTPGVPEEVDARV